MPSWQSYLDEHADRFEGELVDFLRIPSISSLPEHKEDVRRAAEWAAERLRAAGLENVRVMPTSGHPVVYADWLHASGKPTVLIYGHVDVQPVDPVEQWTSPPFDPKVEDGKVRARGAADMKGNLLLTIAAVEALLKTGGQLPVNVKYFVEAEEEIGSPDIPAFLAQNKELFACDLVVSADGGQEAEDQGALDLSTRGLGGVQIDVRGAATDMHSGVYGGAVPNPIHALAAILASMRAPDGRITVKGFYDDVKELGPEERKSIAAQPFDEAELRSRVGVKGTPGEPGYSPQERMSVRPTLEVNGIWGGFQGEGVKTVIPAEAHAKITCRLVPDQRPERIVEALTAHVRANAPDYVEVTVTPLPGRALPYRIAPDHPANKVAAAVLEDLYGKPPVQHRGGGTLPVTGIFLDTLGAYTVGFGFGLNDERFHAPNEFFRLASFRRGQRGYCMLLERLGNAKPSELKTRA